MGRPKKPNKVPTTTWNISEDSHNELQKRKNRKETQDDVIRTLLVDAAKTEELETEIENYRFLLENSFDTMKDLRKTIASLEEKLKENAETQIVI